MGIHPAIRHCLVLVEVVMSEKFVDLLAPKVWNAHYEPLTWAKKHCPSYITNDAVQKKGGYYYRYFFGDERDQILFMLRWS